MENGIVAIIVGAAVIVLLRRIARALRPEADNVCGCGCVGCGQEAGGCCDATLAQINRPDDPG